MRGVEWPTLGLWCVCNVVLGVALAAVATVSVALAGLLIVLALVLHASLTHEVIHGHPFASQKASEALVWVNPGLWVPFLRFRDTHLDHHRTPHLTDPYEDPESNYLDPRTWSGLPVLFRLLRAWHNTLFGRMVVGPLIGQLDFMARDMDAIRRGDKGILRAWVHQSYLAGLSKKTWLSNAWWIFCRNGVHQS
jgi:fatty acid desaturase